MDVSVWLTLERPCSPPHSPSSQPPPPLAGCNAGPFRITVKIYMYYYCLFEIANYMIISLREEVVAF